MEAIIRKGEKGDIDKLVELNEYWYKPNLTSKDNGFLSVTYDAAFFELIITNNDLLVFEVNDKLAGYILVNTIIETTHLQNIKEEYYLLNPNAKVKNIAFSYQILIDKVLQGTGFFAKAQNECFKYFKNKYELLISTVSYENTRSIAAHKNAGWDFIDTKKFFIIEKKL